MLPHRYVSFQGTLSSLIPTHEPKAAPAGTRLGASQLLPFFEAAQTKAKSHGSLNSAHQETCESEALYRSYSLCVRFWLDMG